MRAHRLAAVAAAVCGLLLAGCARLGGLPFQPTVTRPLPLEPGHTVGQTFLAPEAAGTIAGVELLTATHGAAADPQGRLRATLRDGPGGPLLAAAATGGDQIADSGWTPLRFAAPVDPPNPPRRVAIEVSWVGAGAVGLWANVPPQPEPPGALANDPYDGGELLVDGVPARGDLAFRAVGTAGVRALPATLIGAAREAGGRLIRGQPLFAAAWAGLVAAALSLAVVGLRRGRRRPADESEQGRPGRRGRDHDEVGDDQAPDPVGEPGSR